MLPLHSHISNGKKLMAFEQSNIPGTGKKGGFIHPIFEAFKQVSIIVKDHPKKQHILNYLMADTPHSNLLKFHSDKDVSLQLKLTRYKYVIETYGPNLEGKPKDPWEEDESQPSSVFGYQGEQSGKQMKSAFEIAMQKELQSLKAENSDLSHALKEAEKTFQEQQKTIKQLEEQQPKVIEVKINEQTVGKLEGEKFHKQLPLILKLLTARNAMGFSEFLYIWGAPGSGKTHMAKQIAKALGISCYTYPVGPTITEGKLLGFNNIATGNFIPGWLYKAYREGGLVALDEIDLADAAVFGSANSIENDTYTFGNGEMCIRHKDFYLIAFANTQGTGSTKGFTRNILDAATRDRFTSFKLEYDEELEQVIYGNKKWALYVQKVREFVEKNCAQSVYITPRATRKGAAYLAAGIDPQTVVDICIFKSCTKDLQKNIIANVGMFNL